VIVDLSARFNVMSLCSGYGGLDLALRLAVPHARTVCFVEREITAAQILAARFEDGTLDEAPIWTDVRSFRGWHLLSAFYATESFVNKEAA